MGGGGVMADRDEDDVDGNGSEGETLDAEIDAELSRYGNPDATANEEERTKGLVEDAIKATENVEGASECDIDPRNLSDIAESARKDVTFSHNMLRAGMIALHTRLIVSRHPLLARRREVRKAKNIWFYRL